MAEDELTCWAGTKNQTFKVKYCESDTVSTRFRQIHRESSLYLPCRFSQLITEIPGDVLFPQDGPPKTTQLSTQIKKFHRFAEEDSCLINVKVIKHGLRFDGFRRLFAGRSKRNVREEGAGLFSQG